MRTNKFSNTTFGMSLKIPKKASRIGGQALVDATPQLEKMAQNAHITVVPRRGLLTGIKSLIFMATQKGEKKGSWASISQDPKKYLPTGGNCKVVDSFTKEGIVDTAAKALEQLQKGKKILGIFFPADSAILRRFLPKN